MLYRYKLHVDGFRHWRSLWLELGSQCQVPFPGSDWLWVYDHDSLLVELFVSWAGHIWARKGQAGVQNWWLNYFMFKFCLILAFTSVCRVIGPTVGWGENYSFCLTEKID